MEVCERRPRGLQLTSEAVGGSHPQQGERLQVIPKETLERFFLPRNPKLTRILGNLGTLVTKHTARPCV